MDAASDGMYDIPPFKTISSNFPTDNLFSNVSFGVG